MAAALTSRWRPYVRALCSTCSASSRVGTRISARRTFFTPLRDRRCRIGSMNAAVFPVPVWADPMRSEEHTSELQSRVDLVCRLLLEKKNDCTLQLRCGLYRYLQHASLRSVLLLVSRYTRHRQASRHTLSDQCVSCNWELYWHTSRRF